MQGHSHPEVLPSINQPGESYTSGSSDEKDEDIVTDEMLEQDVEELNRDEYKVGEIIDEAIDDLHTIADFLQELQKFKAEHDDKLKALIKLLKSDSVLKKHKVLFVLAAASAVILPFSFGSQICPVCAITLASPCGPRPSSLRRSAAMLPLILPRVHKIQSAGLKEAPDKKHLLAFVQYIGPNNEWFELEIPTLQVEPLLIRFQQIRDDLQYSGGG